jgi:ElaB/YqjD/DUF883 family membrane-anchored ribosome-binding protein
MSKAIKAQKDRLMADLQLVVNETEELFRTTADEASQGAADFRDNIQSGLEQVKPSLSHAKNTAVQGAKAAGKAADHYVHDNPWPVVATAVGVGVVLGFLLRRR